VLTLASDVGLRDLPDVPSLSLGTGVVTPLELTAAYAAFPNGGFAVRPRAIVQVVDADGGVAYDNPARQDRVVSGQVAFQMVSMLEDVLDRGTGASARTTHGVRFPSGGKTGTTDDFKDAWFVGFTTSTVAGVWVGEDQPATIGREGYGARYALPIWSEFIRAATRKRPARELIPATEMQEVTLCKGVVPEAGGGVSDLHRVFQGGRRHPVAPVPGAQGQRQAAGPPRRAGVLRCAGTKVKGDLQVVVAGS
jgi:penicillin-binding protein 1A